MWRSNHTAATGLGALYDQMAIAYPSVYPIVIKAPGTRGDSEVLLKTAGVNDRTGCLSRRSLQLLPSCGVGIDRNVICICHARSGRTGDLRPGKCSPLMVELWRYRDGDRHLVNALYRDARLQAAGDGDV